VVGHASGNLRGVLSVTREQVAAWRLGRHGLHTRAEASPQALLDLASRLCGLHAQVMSSAELTAHARLDGLAPDAVARALWEDRTLVKTWAMRGTLHLLPTADYATYLGATNTYDHYRKPAWLRGFGITAEQRDALIETMGSALDDRILTREELAEAVVRESGREDLRELVRGSWGPFIKPPAFQGKLCFGPNAGRNVCFTSPATWVGVEPDPDGPASLVAIVDRYLAAYGPVTTKEFAAWWATTNPVAKACFGDLDLVEVDREGVTAFARRADAEALAAAEPDDTVRLLPAFDQYVVGALNHIALLLPDPELRPLVSRTAGWISPTIVVDGLIAGVWRHERKGRRLEVTLGPFGRPEAAHKRAAEAEAERMAGVLGGELSVTWADPAAVVARS
jgi:hypothetical protein